MSVLSAVGPAPANKSWMEIMFSEKNSKKLKDLIEKHEGRSSKIYMCTAGKQTAGVGRNMSDNGLRDVEIDFMLQNDINHTMHFLDTNFEWFASLDSPRQCALIDMCFCLGAPRFKQFKMMIMAIAEHRWSEAAYELLDSRFARQVGNRAKTLAKMLEEGVWSS